jgi:NADH:ubiquinone oxidoreductase subunit 6 (subunit J)
MTPELAGWGLVALILFPALCVVVAKNVVHGVLWLGVTLLATSAVYVLLQAPFIAAIQVLLYAGGVVILLIFGVMLTRRHESLTVAASRTHPLRGLLVAVPLFGVLVTAILRSPDPVAGPRSEMAVAELGRALLTDYVLPFEILSLLLLAGMIGAVVIARKKDPVPEPAAAPKEGA